MSGRARFTCEIESDQPAREHEMSKHQVSRRRGGGSRQHDGSEQTERYARVASWIEDPDPFRESQSSADLLGRRAAEAWLRIIGLA
jgi:hypothetical protein